MHLPRFNLTARILLFGLICALILLLAALAAWMQQENETAGAREQNIDSSLINFETRLDDRSLSLQETATWLNKQPEFVNSIATGDAVRLTSYLQGLITAGVVDTATVTDARGDTLVRVSMDLPPSHGESILAQPGIREGLAGKTLLGLRKDDFNLIQSLTAPVLAGEQNSPIGVLRLGFYLDEDDASTAGGQAPHYLADQGTVILQGDPQHKPVLTAPLPPQALANLRQGRGSGFLTLETVHGPYRFDFRPFHSLDANLIAAYGAGLPVDVLPERPSGLAIALGIASLLILSFTCLGAFNIQRRYARPLKELDASARRIGGIDSSTIRMRDGDLDGLGEQINKMHERLAESMRSLKGETDRRGSIMHALPAALMVTDSENRIVDLNPAAEQLLEEDRDKLLGRDWHDVFISSKRDEGGGLFHDEGNGRSPTSGFNAPMHGRFALRQSPSKLLAAKSKPFDLQGRAGGYVHVLEDATELEQFARARDEFMMNAAHELRSPLVNLRTSVEVLNEEQPLLSKQEFNFMLRNMRRSVVRFEAFVENLIDMGNILAGRFMVRPIPCLLQETVDAARSQVLPLLEAKGQPLSIRNNCAVPCRVFADPPRITQVMVNLLTNASKYGPENEPIVLWICDGGKFVSLDVADRGKGIPMEEQAKIFDRFYRGKRGAIEGTGLGLGLAIAKEIIEAHGGQIGIKSQVGEGTTFWFSLPKA